MIGQRLKHYTIDKKIDEGSFGTVYAATNQLINRKVAIKILHPHLGADEKTIARFRQEARSAASLKHPGIVEVIDFVEDSGTFGIVMEFVNGVPLNEFFSGQAQLSLEEKIEIVAKVADALQVAHEAGTIHRDVKPGNILVDESGFPHLTDFGLAKLQDAQKANALTETGNVLGTPAYMSPEQCAGKRCDSTADIYSLGVVLYELTTGRLPFDSDSALGLLQEHIHSVPQSAGLLNPSMPRSLETLVMQCLEKNGDKRPPSAGALASELRNITFEDETSGPKTKVMHSKGEPASRRAVTGAITLFAIICVLASILWYTITTTIPKIPPRPVRYVEVEVEGQPQRARFHNLTDDGQSGMVSFEDGRMLLVPIEGITFLGEESE